MSLPTHIDLQIVTPDKLVVRERVDEVQIPGSDGYFGVLPGHTPLLASLAVGELWYRQGSEKTFISIAFGFAEVLPDSVTILAQFSERAEEIDVDRAEAGTGAARPGWHRSRLRASPDGTDEVDEPAADRLETRDHAEDQRDETSPRRSLT
jgi:F-type H+-transporting ATPase subunit epsilon